MRILMISDVYFPRITGVSTSIQTFAREFIKKGHAVTLIAPDYDRIILEPFEILRIPSRYLPLDPEDRILRPRQIRQHYPTLIKNKFDILHIQTPFLAHYTGIKLAKQLQIPIIESYHTFFEQYFQHYVSFLPSAWLRWITRYFSMAQCNAVDALAVPSQAMLNILKNYGVKTPAQVIPTGIELTQFSQGDGARFRARFQIPPDRPLLIHVSRLAFEKNIDFILRTLVLIKNQIPEVLLIIVGAGPARQQLEQLVNKLQLTENILFTGYLARDGQLEDCYRAGTALVFASRTETQGLVLLEAMALGVPVVSTAVMGTKEVLENGQGSLIAAEQEQDFAAKVMQILTNPQLRANLASAAVKYAQSWSAPVLAERMLDLYNCTIQNYCEKKHRSVKSRI